MARKKYFVRKISAEEWKGNYIFVPKDAVKLFPPAGIAFELKYNGQTYSVVTETYPCWCMGPQNPHNHSKIMLEEFWGKLDIQRGTKVTVTKEGEKVFRLDTGG